MMVFDQLSSLGRSRLIVEHFSKSFRDIKEKLEILSYGRQGYLCLELFQFLTFFSSIFIVHERRTLPMRAMLLLFFE